jgi:hypothetical protein
VGVDDPYELAYGEAVRALSIRREGLDSLRSRAGVVLSGAAIASSLFGGRAVSTGLGLFGWAAVASFAGLGLALLVVLWPRPEWLGTTMPSWIIETDIEVPHPLSVELIRRDLALQIEGAYRDNTVLYEQLARSFQLAAVLLNVEMLAWIIDLATKA